MGGNFCSYIIFFLFQMSWVIPSVFAYPTPVDFNGKIQRWNIKNGDGPILYRVEADSVYDESYFANIIDQAVLMWSNVPSSYFAFKRAEAGQDAPVTLHLKSELAGASYSSGYTIYDFESDSIKTCDMYIATSIQYSTDSIGKTILHEFGHCVGLGHSLIPQAIMSYELNKNSFALDLDDEAAISRLYPKNEAKAELPPGCAVGSYSHQTTKSLFLLLLIFPIFLMILITQALPNSNKID